MKSLCDSVCREHYERKITNITIDIVNTHSFFVLYEKNPGGTFHEGTLRVARDVS